MDVDTRFVDIVRFVDTFSDSVKATNEKTQIQFFLRKKYKKFCVLNLFFIEQNSNFNIVIFAKMARVVVLPGFFRIFVSRA